MDKQISIPPLTVDGKRFNSMTKFLLFAKLIVTRPIWAWNYLWFSNYNPANSNKFHIKRIKDYSQYEFTLTDSLMRTCPVSPEQVNKVLNESLAVLINKKLDSSVMPTKFDATAELAQFCYSVVRLTKPSVIIETGVGRGVTSSFILQALEKNGNGHLFSIELPMLKYGAKQEVGTFVHSSLRARWTLIFGPGVHEMKKLRKEHKNIDIFIHDSNHTYLNQLAEYQIALSWLKKGGILISDDIDNDSLLETSRKFCGKLMVIKQNKPGYIGTIIR